MNFLLAIFKLFGLPTKAFYQAYRHSQRAIRNGLDEANPLVGFRISLFIGAWGVIGAFRSPDQRMLFWLVLSFTGLSCAWQLWPYWKPEPQRSVVPRPNWVNWWLAHHAFTSLVMEVIGVGAMALFIGASDMFDTWQSTLGAIVLILAWLPFCRFIFINLAVLELLKYFADRRLRIVVFRRFQDSGGDADPGFDRRHRTVVLPALGAFAQLSVVHNESLVATPPSASADSEEVVAQLSKAIKFDHADWVYGVSDLIRQTEVAVFHWGSVMSESMLLELRESQRLLSARRLIIIVDGDGGAMISLLQAGFPLGIHVIELGDRYNDFLAELRAVVSDMATSTDAPPTDEEDTTAWNSGAYELLWKMAAQPDNAGPPSGSWSLSGVLGEGTCDLVFAASHMLGRGRDQAGWFLIYGRYEVIDGGTSIRGSKQYFGGQAFPFTGLLQGPSSIAVVGEAGGQGAGDMTLIREGRPEGSRAEGRDGASLAERAE